MFFQHSLDMLWVIQTCEDRRPAGKACTYPTYAYSHMRMQQNCRYMRLMDCCKL